MPLPKPYRNEEEDNFIQRCVIDPEIVRDFDDVEQRVAVCYDIYDRREQKSVAKYEKDYLRQLSIAVNLETLKLRKYFEGQYKKATDQYLQSGQYDNLDGVFRLGEIKEQYKSIYQNIGTRFAIWYSKNYEKYIQKNTNIKAYEEIWNEVFANEGTKLSAALALIVQGTAKNEFQKNLKKLLTDPEFTNQNSVVKARILKKRFATLSEWQALRIVKTEGNYVANLGTAQSAKTFFGEDGTNKVWNCNFRNSRDWHISAHTQKVGFKENFVVDGEPLSMPGDPRSSASNRINCNCYLTFERKPDAQAITDLTGIGFGLATQAIIEELIDGDEI